MAHILILKSNQSNELVRSMLCTAVDVVKSYGHTYDELQVPSVKELPLALNSFTESHHYEATICLGIMHPNLCEDSKIHYVEIVKCFYEYTTYFGHLIGQAIVYNDLDKINITDVTAFTQEIATNICEFIKLNRDLNSIEGTRYRIDTPHN